jgi:hypothetical protein
MQNINRISRARLLSCAAIGLVVSVSPCFAADLGASQGMQPLGTAPPEIMPFRCDSLDPKVCFDIYGRTLNNTPWLFYGTVGGGWEHDKISGNPGISGNVGGLPFSNEGWSSGWTAGAGVEWKKFAPSWSTNFKYRLGTPPNWFGTVPPFK